jgi:uncharacterized protein (UPF0548 family)
MLLWRRPTETAIRAFRGEQGRLELTYSAVGATAKTPPVGYVVDHTRIRLGQGEAVFRAAQGCPGALAAVPPWLAGSEPRGHAYQGRPGGGDPGPVPRHVVAQRLPHCGGEDKPVKRFGFAYGTLPDHAGSGEERFLVEWDRNDDSVWYDILAFSRPRHFLARLGYPWVRRAQKRFGRESAAVMRQAVAAAGTSPS